MATSANRDDGADGIADPADILAGVPHLSSDSSKIFCVPISTRIDPAGFLHKFLRRHLGLLAMSDIPQCSRPFADRLAIGAMARGAANDGSKWVCVLVKGKTRKLERMPQKSTGPSPHPVVHDYLEHRA
jgi:hypothetical protein